MRCLDLYCGAGGASMGYKLAGFELVGVDIKEQRHYPFHFVRADALTFVSELANLAGVDFIHASPPCQRYSVLRHVSEHKGNDSPDLVAATREALIETGLPYVIENVVGAPLYQPTLLCGSMFDLGAMSGNGETIPRAYRQLRRHRLFESNVPLFGQLCLHTSDQSIGVYGHDPGQTYYGNMCKHEGEALGVYGGAAVPRNAEKQHTRRGGYQGTMPEKREAMRIDWMTRNEINQAIPPAYTEYLGGQILAWIEAQKKAPTEAGAMRD